VVQDLVAKGTGSSRQKAEQGAARAMLEKLSA
jgi:dsRNA-specific ribonuclease